MFQTPNTPIQSCAVVRPVIKWAGGKSGLLAKYAPHFPQPGSYRRYFEPFIGSAAVFFYLNPAQSVLSDSNAELIDVYRAIRDCPDDLIAALGHHHHDRDYYYVVRAQKPVDLSLPERAARFIFLNKTGYNGLYRVNSRGEFNVPFGKHRNPKICDERNIRAAHVALQSAALRVVPFEQAVQDAEEGDLIYFDPPYAPLSATSNFTSYTSDGFGADDQRKLAGVFHTLHERGCLLMLSNSSAPLIYDLYSGYGYHLHEIAARRAINSKANGRGEITELLITNFKGNNER